MDSYLAVDHKSGRSAETWPWIVEKNDWISSDYGVDKAMESSSLGLAKKINIGTNHAIHRYRG